MHAAPAVAEPGRLQQDDAYRRMLWAVLAVNAVTFAVEVIAKLPAASASLQAGALDFSVTPPTTQSARRAQ
jgi:hypothetical protein